ncbi:hypothetical protein [Streptomyces sp. NPDC091879]|uniref:hypothetical protein n=1 Tax=Streptomyces sp. NPDC091879 TaxID=3366006 RepID=UPI003828C830
MSSPIPALAFRATPGPEKSRTLADQRIYRPSIQGDFAGYAPDVAPWAASPTTSRWSAHSEEIIMRLAPKARALRVQVIARIASGAVSGAVRALVDWLLSH